MSWLITFIICVAMALVNLPFVLSDGGSMLNLMSLILCDSLSVFALVMAGTDRR